MIQFKSALQTACVSYNNSNLKKVLAPVPTAEKNALFGAALTLGAALVTQCLTSHGGLVVVLGLGATAYKYITTDKPKQDEALTKYFEETRNILYDQRKIFEIYRTSPNVAALGGSRAINNATAFRVFTKF